MRLACLRAPPEDARDVHDHTAATWDHVAQRRARTAKRPVQRDIQNDVPLHVGHVDDVRRPAEAGVVHRDVDAAVLGDGRVEQALDVGLLGHVRRDAEHAELRCGLFETPVVLVADHDGGAFLDAAFRRCKADARARRSGDENDLPLQQIVWEWCIRHRRPPRVQASHGARPASRRPAAAPARASARCGGRAPR